MTVLDIAQAMRGKLRDGVSAVQAGGTAEGQEICYGTAQADSADGFVPILLDNAPTEVPGYDPADYTFTVACDAPISNGDRVSYIVIDGVGKAISLGGLTDMAEQAADDAASASQAAADALQAAQDIETSTGNYFWHDTAGIHVSSSSGSATGTRNVLFNTLGLLFRKASNYLMTIGTGTSDTGHIAFYDGNGNTTDHQTALITPTLIELGKNCSTPTAGSTTGTVSIKMLNLFSLAAKYISFIFPSGGANYQVGLDIDAATTQMKNVNVSGSCSIAGECGSSTAIFYDKYGQLSLRGSAATLTNNSTQNLTTSYASVTLGSSSVSSNENLTKYGTAGIKCAKAGTVLVSATLYCSGVVYTNNVAAQIRKGSSTSVAEVAVGGTAGTNNVTTANITPRAITVAANDVFYLYAKASTAVTSGIVADGATLTVQYI